MILSKNLKEMDAKEDKSNNDFKHAIKLDVSKDVEEYKTIKEGMAMNYPFELDPFQQQAICFMEKGDSVFVAAHTSAGKTVVAEYAVALCKKNSSRVIYTSPIKALSNQKFRDFKKAFGDVGLITGDIQLHSDAYCLIMTTEILKSMLYNGSEVVRELEWVIFDEVHYINDIERGHVWEEVLIMLPSHVKIVMLSATVPNCLEFADWVGRIKQRFIYVIQTLKRPVPLVHHLYTGQDGKTKKDLFCIFREGNFITSGYQKAVEAKNKKAQSQKGGGGGGPGGRGWSNASQNHPALINKNNKNIYINLIDYLKTEELLPMIVFIFSRQRCDETARLLQSVDLTSANEKSAIHRFFNRCIDRLTGTDKELPQVLLMQEHCKRGFAVHHSGILPIIKEVVEMLFQQGLVKILFATETFAMGVNMPARTVVFDGIEKHDGKQKRLLNATEYVQMAGRAGRRGLDTTGTVIILAKGPSVMEIDPLKRVLQGKPIKLESKFRMTYSMMLNLLRVEHMTIQDMLQSSYVERASLRMVLSKKERLKEIDAQIVKLPQIECAFCHPQPVNSHPSLSDYSLELRQYYEAFTQTWTALVAKSSKDAKLFGIGRLILIHHDPLGIVGRMAVILGTRSLDNGQFLMTLFVPTFQSNNSSSMNGEVKEIVYKKALSKEEQKWQKEALLLNHALTNGIEGIEKLRIGQSFVNNAKFTILEDIGIDSLMGVCKKSIPKQSEKTAQSIIDEHHRLRAHPNSQISQEVEKLTRAIFMEMDKMVDKFATQQNNAAELLYILGDDTDKKEVELVMKLREMKDRRQMLLDPERFPCRQCPNIKEHMENANERRKLEETKQELAYQTSYDSLQFSGEYAGRIKVLRALGYIDKQNMVSVKGKLACEISNQELLITELILDNKFNDRSPPEIAAMFSALTFQFDGKINRQRAAIFGGGNGQMAANNNGGGGNGEDGQQNGEENTGEEQPTVEMKEPQQQSTIGEIERVPIKLLKELEADLVEAAMKIDKIQKECKVNSFVLDELKFGLMEVVHQWASGMEFAKIMRLSDAQEGIIVRCIQRLVEVCKDVGKAAMIVGNPELADKMEETSTAIRRDIVFAASLYVTED